MNKIGYWVVGLGLMSVTLPSCRIFKHKTSKKKKAEMAAQAALMDSTTSVLRNQTTNADTDEAQKALIQQTQSVWDKKIDLKTFSTKAKLHYEGGGKSIDFVANIRMRKDSVIWVSVTVAGIIQAARAVITPDSFAAILYTEKEAYKGPISKVNSILPEGLDFYALQNVILGNPILNKAKTTQVLSLPPNWVIRFQRENYIEQTQFDIADSTLKSSQLITQGTANKSLSHTLSNYGLFNNIKIALDRKLNIQNDSSTLAVDMNYSNILIDTELTYPFSIPKNYTIK